MHEGKPEDGADAEKERCEHAVSFLLWGKDKGRHSRTDGRWLRDVQWLMRERDDARAPLLEQLRIKDMFLYDLRNTNASLTRACDNLHARVKVLELQLVTARGDAAHWMTKHDEMRDRVAELEAKVSVAAELKGR